MRKSQLLRYLAEHVKIPQKTALALLDELLNIATKETRSKGVFPLPGFGRLRKTHRKARKGRNPQTGETIKIPAKTVVRFRVSERLKRAIVGENPPAIGTGQVSSAKARRLDLRIRPNRALLAHYPNYLGRVHDISLSGAFIEGQRPPLPGQKVRVTFWGDVENTLEVEAVVQRVDPLRGIGVKFLPMNGAGVRFLCNYWVLTPPQVASERRTPFPRINPKEHIVAEFPGLIGRVWNINPFGALVEHNRPIPVGQRLSFNLWVNGLGTIPVQGRVQRVAEQGLGVSFLSLVESDFNRLWEYLSRHT